MIFLCMNVYIIMCFIHENCKHCNQPPSYSACPAAKLTIQQILPRQPLIDEVNFFYFVAILCFIMLFHFISKQLCQILSENDCFSFRIGIDCHRLQNWPIVRGAEMVLPKKI